LNAGPVDTLEVRGELVISNSEFARINSELEANGLPLHSNPRNLVSGSMKKRDVSELSNRKIEFVPWDMFSPDDDNILPDSSFIRMSMLTDMGFVKYEGFFVDTISANVEEIIKNILRMNEESDIIADGVVIKADSHEIRNKLNYGTKFSKFQHCYKPQNLSAETEVLDIEWGTGRQGKITPVLLITPTEVGGSIVSRITGNNITWMKELDVKIHSKISFVKSGDTIPMVTEVLDNSEATPIVIPTTCPKCNTPVSIKNDTGIEILLCENSSCSGKAAETFYYVGHRDTLEIDNLGAEMSKYLVNNNITNLADLFEFSNNHLTTSKDQFKNLGFYSGANTVKLVKSLQDAKTRDWDKWIAALSIPFIGHTLGERIAMDLNLQPDDMFNLCDEFLNISVGQIEGLGPVKYNTLLEWAALPQNRLLCDRLSKAGVTPTPITNKEPIMGDLSNITFCITGTFKGTFGTRPVITEKLEALGAKSVPAVTKTCNLLIVGENAGSKLEKAAKLGIKIVDETWLAEVL
jgi:DNA ligase (NAD+)